MRHPTTFKFLSRAGPTLVVFVGGCLGLVGSYAQSYTGVRDWGQKQFEQLWPILSAPRFIATGGVAICAYIGALLYTGLNKRSPLHQRTAGDPVQEAIDRLGPNPLGTPVEAERIRRSQEWQRTVYWAMNAPNGVKRALISKGRELVHRYRETQFAEPFGQFIQRDPAYLDIQPHLGTEYCAEAFGRAEKPQGSDSSTSRDYDSAMFLRELARLEREWGLI